MSQIDPYRGMPLVVIPTNEGGYIVHGLGLESERHGLYCEAFEDLQSLLSEWFVESPADVDEEDDLEFGE